MKNFTQKLTLFVAMATVASSVSAFDNSWFKLPSMTLPKVALSTMTLPTLTQVQAGLSTAVTASKSAAQTAGTFVATHAQAGYSAAVSGMSTVAAQLPTVEVVRAVVVKTTANVAAQAAAKKEVIGFVTFAAVASWILKRTHGALIAAEEKAETVEALKALSDAKQS